MAPPGERSSPRAELDDPFHWDIDQVIAAINPNADSQISDTLRHNEVDGEVLLTVASLDTLKNELGIGVLGKRCRIMRVVNQLRRRSPAYAQYSLELACSVPLPLPRDDEMDIKPMLIPGKRKRRESSSSTDIYAPPASVRCPATPSRLQTLPTNETTLSPLTPASTCDAASPLRSSSPAHIQPNPLPANHSPRHTRQTKPLRLLARENSGLPLIIENPWITANGAVQIDSAGGSVPYGQLSEVDIAGDTDVDMDTSGPGPIVPGHSEDEGDGLVTNVQDEQSQRSVRRIAPTMLQEIETRDAPMNEPSVLEAANPLEINPGDGDVKSKGRKKKAWYFAPKARKIDSIFYDVDVGEEIDVSDDDDNFQLCTYSVKKPAGERRYVARQIRRFLDEPEIAEGVFKGHLRTARKPYSNAEKYLQRYEPQSFTVFQAQPGDVSARRETTVSLSLPWSDTASKSAQTDKQIFEFADAPMLMPREDNGTDWEYLYKWNNVDRGNEVLPAFGESGSENEYDIATWREIEKEQGGGQIEKPLAPTRRQALSAREIEEAVDEAIEQMIERWREKELPKKEAIAYKVWKRAAKAKRRRETAKRSKAKIERLDERIGDQRQKFAGSVMGWFSKEQVRKQAKGNMDASVTDRETEKWLVHLMEQRHAPKKVPKPVSSPRPDPIGKADEADGEGEEEETAGDSSSVGSDSDDVIGFTDEDEGMDGFVVPDGTKDYLDGQELEVEGEKELQEELALMKESEAVEPDSEVEEDDSDIPSRRRRKLRQPSPEEDEPILIDPDTEEQDNMDPSVDSGNAAALPSQDSPRRVKNEPLATQPSSTQPQVIDLTQHSSPPPESIRRGRPTESASRRRSQNVQVVDLSDSEEEEDPSNGQARRRLTRAIKKLEVIQRQQVLQRVNDLHKVRFSVHDLFHTIGSALADIHNNKRVSGLSQHGSDMYKLIALLYRCWMSNVPDPRARIRDTNQEMHHLKNLEKFQSFWALLSEVIREFPECPKDDDDDKSAAKRKRIQKGSEPDERSPSPEEEESSQYRKRRRREMIEDQGAKERRMRHEKSQKLLERRIRNQARNSQQKGQNVDNGKVIVNLGHYAKYKDITVHDDIARALKKHQVEGIQFMWQQLVQMDEKRGALLAHTMGLGKTLQVITLLHTLASAGASEDPGVREQIPKHLRESKTLILCPPSLLENWWDEFQKWLPTKEKSGGGITIDYGAIGIVEHIDPSKRGLIHFHKDVIRWAKNGGVLILGYQSFLRFCTRSEHKDIGPILLESPNIVIADEAHHLKNPAAAVTKYANEFRTLSRIAMTGSPLSNSLTEYWAMIEWIDPNYLGPLKEFERKYVQPIQDGLYADSTQAERRRALTTLQVLKSAIKFKVNRAGINVIQNDLPQKTEFMITVPLSKLQIEMYLRFIEDDSICGIAGQTSVRDIRAPTAGTKFFDIVHLLSLICNHPRCFVQSLENREKNVKDVVSKNEISKQVLEEELANEPDEKLNEEAASLADPVSSLLVKSNQQPYPWAKELLEGTDGDSIDHSYKMRVLKSILDFSIDIGDQVLVFSHSIPTLDYLQSNLEEWGLNFFRLDGQTKMNQRQLFTKKFNRGEADVYLVSTQAGGLGLNLPGANRVVIFDFKWSPMWEEQAVGRAYRMGQRKHVYVYRMIAGGTMEEYLKNTMLFKMQLADKVVDQKNVVHAAERKKGLILHPPVLLEQEDLSEFKGKDPVLDKTIETGDILGISLTETFLDDVDPDLTEEEQQIAEQMRQELMRGREAHQNPSLPTAVLRTQNDREDAEFRQNGTKVYRVQLDDIRADPTIVKAGAAEARKVEEKDTREQEEHEERTRKLKAEATEKKRVEEQARKEAREREERARMQERLAEQQYLLGPGRHLPRMAPPSSQPNPVGSDSGSSSEPQRTLAMVETLNRRAERSPLSATSTPPSSTAPVSKSPRGLVNKFNLQLNGVLPKVFRGRDSEGSSGSSSGTPTKGKEKEINDNDEPAGTLHLKG